MSFIATAGNSAGKVITNNSFFPDVSLDKCRELTRLDGTVTDGRLEHALINAIAQTNQDLYEWRIEQQSNGIAKLEDIPSDTINNKSILLHHYERAVFCFSRANLIERYADYDTTAKGDKKTDSLQDTIADLRRDGRYAVRDLLGVNHVTVDLI